MQKRIKQMILRIQNETLNYKYHIRVLEHTILTPPEYSYVQIGPFKAFPTTPPSNVIALKCNQNN